MNFAKRFLVLLILGSSVGIFAVESCKPELQLLAPTGLSKRIFCKTPFVEEGLYANSQIKVTSEGQPFTLTALDDNPSNCEKGEKLILGISRKLVDRYVKILINEKFEIFAGRDQQFLTHSNTWITAKKLSPGDQLAGVGDLNCVVTDVELINCSMLMYAPTVEGHTFYTMPSGVCAHNTDLAIGASAIWLSNVAFVNPVVTLLGVTVAFSVVAQQAYEAYVAYAEQASSTASASPQPLEHIPNDVRLAERHYYDQRKAELLTLRDEFLSVKNGILAIRGLFQSADGSFTAAFLQSKALQPERNCHLKISASDELKFSQSKRNQLRKLREIELSYLEQEIFDIQVSLVLHFDLLVENLGRGIETYNEAASQIRSDTELWNKFLGAMSDAIAFRVYEGEVLEGHLLDMIYRKINELSLVVNYYRYCTNACVGDTSTILQLAEELTATLPELEDSLRKQSLRVSQNIRVVEQYFANQGVSTHYLKAEKQKKLTQGRRENEKRLLEEANEKKSSVLSGAGGPKKDDEDEKKATDRIKCPENENDLKHIFRDKEGHIPRDTPEARRMLEELVNDPANYRGPDQFGTRWFSKILKNGEQLWAKVGGNNRIKNAGINKVPRAYNPEMGLCMRLE